MHLLSWQVGLVLVLAWQVFRVHSLPTSTDREGGHQQPEASRIWTSRFGTELFGPPLDALAQHVIPFTTTRWHSFNGKNLRGFGPTEDPDGVFNSSGSFVDRDGSAGIAMVGQGNQIAYVAEIYFGAQGPFKVVIDTGSSDSRYSL